MTGNQSLRDHIEAIQVWLKGQATGVDWNRVLIGNAEDILHNGKLRPESLCDPKDMEEQFSEYLMRGYSWINIPALGVHNDALILSIELPRSGAGTPRDKVSINFSGSAKAI